MKRILLSHKLCISLILLSLAGTTLANTTYNTTLSNTPWFKSMALKPYLGLEYQYEHIKPARAYQGILSANFQYGNLFVGTKFRKSFGLELGYYFSLKTSQQQNSVFQFNRVAASDLTSTLTRTSYKGFNLDAAVYYALDPKFNVYALVGLTTMHPTMSFSDTTNNKNTNLARALPLITAKNSTVPRLGMGWEILERHWGIRSRVMWVYTQNITMNVDKANAIYPGIPAHPYLQAVEVTAGVFYRF